jgi:hypothetical protein
VATWTQGRDGTSLESTNYIADVNAEVLAKKLDGEGAIHGGEQCGDPTAAALMMGSVATDVLRARAEGRHADAK